jgi:5,10-methylenetetrahydrofolate reductase
MIDMHRNIICEKIIYHVVGKYTRDEFIERLIVANEHNFHSVFVGAASKHQLTRVKLAEAYEIWRSYAGNGLLGGVVIPERHHRKNDEHLRIIEKQKSGCSFFVSQCVCNLELTKNFISDYCYAVEDTKYEKSYFVFTLSVCGSVETLHLMNWLGIDIPKWMKNDLSRGKDILKESINQNIKIAEEIKKYCQEKDLPCGFNVESISPKKAEIEAAIELNEQIKKMS